MFLTNNEPGERSRKYVSNLSCDVSDVIAAIVIMKT